MTYRDAAMCARQTTAPQDPTDAWIEDAIRHVGSEENKGKLVSLRAMSYLLGLKQGRLGFTREQIEDTFNELFVK